MLEGQHDNVRSHGGHHGTVVRMIGRPSQPSHDPPGDRAPATTPQQAPPQPTRSWTRPWPEPGQQDSLASGGTRESRRTSAASVVLGVAVVLAVLASLVLRAHTAIVSYPNAGHDDGLFVRLAYAIAQGEWLGAYDKMTLAKGPAYPMFLALTAAAGIQAKLAEHLVYLAGVGVMAYAVWLLSRSRALSVALFVILALNPYAWTDHLARILRDSLYLGLSLLVAAAAFWLILWRVRQASAHLARDVVVMLAIGITTGLYWLTKEEGLWLAPSMMVVGVAALWYILRAGSRDAVEPVAPSRRGHFTARLRGARARALGRLLTAVGVVAIGAFVTLGSIAAMNWAFYGVPLLNDFRDGELPAAVGALSRIETESQRRYVIVPKAARLAAYEVSPAAVELEPFLEGPLQGWIAPGCAAGGHFVDPSDADTCDDFYAGWFYWAVRDAVALAGHWDSAAESQAFLGRIADEINDACEDGRLMCREEHASVIPRLDVPTVREMLELVPAGLQIMVDIGPIGYAPSEGEPMSHMWLARVTRGQLAPSAAGPPTVTVAGWIAAPGRLPTVSVNSQSTPFRWTITRTAGPDVVEGYEKAGRPDWQASRFLLETDCLAADCEVVVTSERGTHDVGTEELKVGYVEARDFGFNIDTVTYGEGSQDAIVATPRHPLWLTITRALQGLYVLLVPVSTAVASLGVLLAILVGDTRRRYGTVLVVAIACAVAVLARIALLALIEVTSWPSALNYGYLGLASPFLLTFAACGVFLMLAAVRSLTRTLRLIQA